MTTKYKENGKFNSEKFLYQKGITDKIDINELQENVKIGLTNDEKMRLAIANIPSETEIGKYIFDDKIKIKSRNTGIEYEIISDKYKNLFANPKMKNIKAKMYGFVIRKTDIPRDLFNIDNSITETIIIDKKELKNPTILLKTKNGEKRFDSQIIKNIIKEISDTKVLPKQIRLSISTEKKVGNHNIDIYSPLLINTSEISRIKGFWLSTPIVSEIEKF